MRVPSAVTVGVVAALVGAAGVGCGSGPKTAPVVVAMAGQTVATSKLQTIAGGICDAARQAPSDLNTARQTFFGTSHDGIHLIARGLEEKDRAAAATLLETKQKVEADFSAPTPRPGAQVAADLTKLAAVTRTSLARFKVTADPCPAS
jgi:hypothetical protein